MCVCVRVYACVCVCVYKMNSGAERLTKERKITAEKYSGNKIHTICLCRKCTDEDYVIWVKMIDLQKLLCHRKLCHVAMKKIKNFCKTNHPTRKNVKKYKRKTEQWLNDNKSVYIREDVAYKIICYINVGVIEAEEFLKHLGVENDKSIRKKRKIIAIIMKIFAKEKMVRQYQVLGLPYMADLCFVDHKLGIEIDEDGHAYFENDETRQNLIENHGFTFIRINPDPDRDAGFDLDVEIAKIYNYINESSLK